DPARFESCADPAGRAAYEQALVHLQAGRDQDALPLLRRAAELCPDNVLVHGLHQDTALHLGGDAQKAMRAFYEQLPASEDSPVPAWVKARLVESTFARVQAVQKILARHP